MLIHIHICEFTQTSLEKIAPCDSTGQQEAQRRKMWIQIQTKPVIINFVSHPNNIFQYPSKAQRVAFRLAWRGSIMPPSPRKPLVVVWHLSCSPFPVTYLWEGNGILLILTSTSPGTVATDTSWCSWCWWLQQRTADIISHHKKHNLSFPSYEMGYA